MQQLFNIVPPIIILSAIHGLIIGLLLSRVIKQNRKIKKLNSVTVVNKIQIKARHMDFHVIKTTYDNHNVELLFQEFGLSVKEMEDITPVTLYNNNPA